MTGGSSVHLPHKPRRRGSVESERGRWGVQVQAAGLSWSGAGANDCRLPLLPLNLDQVATVARCTAGVAGVAGACRNATC